jgi:hypothetical protein
MRQVYGNGSARKPKKLVLMGIEVGDRFGLIQMLTICKEGWKN